MWDHPIRRHVGLQRRTLRRGLVAALCTGVLMAALQMPALAAETRIDVNAASAAELATLPGIGAAKAAAIVAERERAPFRSVDDLERVDGIGAKTLSDLREKVTVGQAAGPKH